METGDTVRSTMPLSGVLPSLQLGAYNADMPRRLPPVEVIRLDPQKSKRELKQLEARREREASEAREEAEREASKAREEAAKKATEREEAAREAAQREAARKRNLGAATGEFQPSPGTWDDGRSKGGW
ncbi:hypothetical protein WME94_34455 [Sorangium sp. So ce429]